MIYESCGVIQSHELNHHQFQSSLLEIDAEYGDGLCYKEAPWLSHGTVLTCFSALIVEIKMFQSCS
jgi:hypothetical protein